MDEPNYQLQMQSQQIEGLSPLAVGDQKLNRHLGQIIGTGIFSNSSYILANCGSGGMMMILWWVGAIFAITGVWNYLELGTMATYQYRRPRELISFVFVIIVGMFGKGSGLAQGATVFGSNVIYAIGGADYINDWAARGFAVFCLVFWLVMNIVSSKTAIGANNAFTILKLILLILLICVGFAGLTGQLPNQPDLSVNFSFQGTLSNPGSYANAIYFVIFAYGGWSNLNYVVDELKDPIKNLPKCSITAVYIYITHTLTIAFTLAYLAVLSKDVIVNSDATVAANLFNTALGGVFGSRVLPVLIGLSSFGSVGSIFFTGSRIILEAARKGYLPYDRFFAKSHPKLQTPVNSLLLLFIISLIFLLAPPPGAVFEFILAFAGYGDYFFSVMSVIGLLIMRRTHPDIKRPIKTSIVASIIFIMMCIYNLVFIFVPPTSSSASYPYWLPYLMTIIVALLSVGIWYYKVEYKDALSKSYNAEIREDGKQELFEDIYDNDEKESSDLSVEEISKEIDMTK
ncbi:hypothetical protein G6F37_004408 [Rhizopus arrhizus]|nr:hypothetical protein G6F38_004545 [Rhizopus arrhizus]KAG1159968.1 hypothetical protein G6F37_004408 [Rhizopus arrhizus]